MRRPSLLIVTGSILGRLPFGFLLPFIVFAYVWTFHLFHLYKVIPKFIAESIFGIQSKTEGEYSVLMNLLQMPITRLSEILWALYIIAFYVAGIILAYNLAVLTNWLLVQYGPKPVPVASVVPHRPPHGPAKDNCFENTKKIGIVLAGGGAKGAFQAGAMKAIYQFLVENNALQKVKVISATSIGSWNALFWLSDLIKSEKGWGEQSVHESWWRSISLRSLVAPSWWAPLFRNAFLETTPWRKSFDDIFGQDAARERIIHSDIHFYLTRSHVGSGQLECTTNNMNACDLPRVKFKRVDLASGNDAFLEGVKIGVFASMDLPPLFPYMEMDDHFYEDGGVIDNLPVMFAAMESCDLIFVLPLNSDFIAIPDRRSLLKRFLRVMDVRQGALERASLKGQYLYNELAALRNYARTLEDKLSDAKIELPVIEMSKTLRGALDRTHEESRIFAICPQRSLAEHTIDTHELWKWKKAGFAFSVMYRGATYVLTKEFDPKKEFDPQQEKIEMALIDDGEIRWASDF